MIIKEIKAIMLVLNDVLNNTILGGIFAMALFTTIILTAMTLINSATGTYTQYATVYCTDINETVLVDAVGDVWAIDATDEFNEGDTVIITFDSNGTDNTRYDDIIVEVKKAD